MWWDCDWMQKRIETAILWRRWRTVVCLLRSSCATLSPNCVAGNRGVVWRIQTWERRRAAPSGHRAQSPATKRRTILDYRESSLAFKCRFQWWIQIDRMIYNQSYGGSAFNQSPLTRSNAPPPPKPMTGPNRLLPRIVYFELKNASIIVIEMINAVIKLKVNQIILMLVALRCGYSWEKCSSFARFSQQITIVNDSIQSNRCTIVGWAKMRTALVLTWK